MSVVEVNVEEPNAPPKATVLELRDFTFRGASEHSVQLLNVDLKIVEGELVVLHLDPSLKSREFVSVLQGLKQPTGGTVHFQNEDWLGTDYDKHFEMRSRIGRVFEGHAWVANLNVAENVALPCLHHGHSTRDLAKHWARRFGLKQVSRQRPAFLEPSQLQIHQWIRALVCQPALLLLERPMMSVPQATISTLCEVVDEVRGQGTAVVWITSKLALTEHEFEPAAMHYAVQSESLVEMEGGFTDE